ncbi:MAG: 4Fe-4S binding protein [Negativicutes bacterium]|nr:4Fe-4S binding protein [Negativicutes bacterium]
MTHVTTNPPNRKPRKSQIRSWIQGFFLLLVFAISLKKYLTELGFNLAFLPNASLHAICPFGGVVSLYQFFTVGTFVQKIHESSFVLMLAGLALAVLAGPVICGWVCPFGTVQELIGKLGRKLNGKRYNHFIPAKIDKVLRYLRYLVLATVVYQTAVTGKLIYQGIDPYYALFNLWTDELAPAALSLLAITVIASLFVERPWCKYACPYGALLGLTNFIRIFKIKRNRETCIQCGACDRACPMNITVSASDTVSNHQCISCLKCTSEQACPIAKTVALQIGKGERA